LDIQQEHTFRQLFEENKKKVFNISLNIVQNIEDAEDLTQEVFIEVHNSLHLFREQSSVSTWIYRITVNRSLDFVKAKKRKKRFAFLSQLFNPETGEQLHEVSHFDHPGVLAENKERSQILFSLINRLPETQKSAFILSQIEGFSHKEIAEIMKTSAKAVDSLIQRAKINLRKILEKLYPERGDLN
jgi:RNA polymerase sigma factor (sigma-70 family)